MAEYGTNTEEGEEVNFFITGATGFIGRRVAAKLLSGGHRVVCLVLASDSAKVVGELTSYGATCVIGDVTEDVESLVRKMVSAEVVIHLAGIYDFCPRDPDLMERVNVSGAINVGTAAAFVGARMVHGGSVTAYGRQVGPFDESAEFGKPMSLYADTKQRALLVLRKIEGLVLTELHPCAVVGPGDIHASGGFINSLIHPIWWKRLPGWIFGLRHMSWAVLDDVVDCIVAAAVLPDMAHRRFIVGGAPNVIQFRVLTKLIQEVFGTRWPFRINVAWWFILPTAHLLYLVHLGSGRKWIPPLGWNPDQARTMSAGIQVVGTRAEQDLLGRPYRPLRDVLIQIRDELREAQDT